MFAKQGYNHVSRKALASGSQTNSAPSQPAAQHKRRSQCEFPPWQHSTRPKKTLVFPRPMRNNHRHAPFALYVL